MAASNQTFLKYHVWVCAGWLLHTRINSFKHISEERSLSLLICWSYRIVEDVAQTKFVYLEGKQYPIVFSRSNKTHCETSTLLYLCIIVSASQYNILMQTTSNYLWASEVGWNLSFWNGLFRLFCIKMD